MSLYQEPPKEYPYHSINQWYEWISCISQWSDTGPQWRSCCKIFIPKSEGPLVNVSVKWTVLIQDHNRGFCADGSKSISTANGNLTRKALLMLIPFIVCYKHDLQLTFAFTISKKNPELKPLLLLHKVFSCSAEKSGQIAIISVWV